MSEVAQIKTLRRDIDEQIQNVKAMPPSRERSFAITKLQEAVMWLGMDLKRINEESPTPAIALSPIEAAMAAYHRYGSVTDFKNFRGEPMPSWEDLPKKIQEAWIAAADTNSTAHPYPESMNPDNPTIEPTADGLKL